MFGISGQQYQTCLSISDSCLVTAMRRKWRVTESGVRTVHDPAYVKLVQHLRARRLELGLTQAEVGQRMGVSRTFVVLAERQERRLDVLELYRLLKVYGMRLAAVERLLASGKRP